MPPISKESQVTLGFALVLALGFGHALVVRSQVDDLRTEVAAQKLAIAALTESSRKADSDHEVRIRLLEEQGKQTASNVSEIKGDVKTLVNGMIRPARGSRP